MSSSTRHIPGTVRVLNTEHAFYTGDVGGRREDIILVPPPSDDPDDPLNWSDKRKRLAMACMLGYTVAIGISSAAIYSVLENISAHTDLSLSTLNQGTGYMFLSFGWGCLFWQPLALQYGKRPVYLFSTLGTMITMIWAPRCTSKSTWIASKVLQGFFGAPIESLCGITVTDLYFVHERGFYTTIYALVLSGSSTSAPIVSGFIADGQGWRWVLYWCAILCALILALLSLFMEETNYRRTPGDANNAENNSYLSKKTWASKLRLWQVADLQQPTRLTSMMTRPLIYATFPVVVFCGFSYGSSLLWYSLLNATSSLVLTKIYRFRTSTVGASYIAVLFGVLIGAAYTGICGNKYTMQLARKNGGLLESEYRLRLLIPAIVILPGGFILWGVGAYHRVHWVGVVFGMFLITGASSIMVQESINYCIGSYPLAGEAIVSVILIRNTMIFGLSYGLTPWVLNLGLQNAFIIAAMAALLQCSTVIGMITYGKRWREKSAPRYRKYVKQLGGRTVDDV